MTTSFFSTFSWQRQHLLPFKCILFGIACLFATALQAQQKGQAEALPDIDIRFERPRQAVQARQLKASDNLQAVFPGLKVEWNAITGNVKSVHAEGRFLTSPSSDAPIDIALNYVKNNEALFGLKEKDLADLIVTHNSVSKKNGMRRLIFQQQYKGIYVYGAELRVNLTARGEIINCGSDIIPSLAEAIENKSAAVKPEQAIRTAATSIKADASASPKAIGAAEGAMRKAVFSDDTHFMDDIHTQLFYWAIDRKTVRLVWSVSLGAKNGDFVYQVFVDASNGQTVFRTPVSSAEAALPKWRVFTSDSPNPMSPGTATPNGAQGPAVSRQLVETNGDAVASPGGWIPGGGTVTTGNNADAFLDKNNDGTPDSPRPSSATQEFDFPLDFTLGPGNADNQRSAIVNAFYWANWYHDKMYAFGFDEASGNFQTDNFGRGGIGNDPVRIRVQSGTNNSTFATQPDGIPGIWRAFIFTGPTPDRDAAFDQEIAIHELTHGLTNRLVGGPSLTMSGLQPRAMGEGWSDFYAFALLAEAGDDLNGNWAMGAYSLFDWVSIPGGWDDNYYFGIRRFPHSRDMNRSPLTFADIDPAQFAFNPAIPMSPWLVGSSPDQVHNAGEVWCAALMECRANLIELYGFNTGNDLMIQLVTDGLKLIPTNTPTYLQARDAILMADMVNNGGANQCLLWKGFSKRGMGPDATVPAFNSTSGIVENFYTPMQPLLAAVKQPTCPASCDGAINLMVNGGRAPYNFAWSNGASTEDLGNLCADTYTVMVTDNLGCKEGFSVVLPDGADITPPVITCPADITVSCDTSAQTGTGMAVVTDNCDPNPRVSYTDSHLEGECEWLCKIQRTWTATDQWGNTSKCVQIIEKNTLPLIIEALSADLNGDGKTDTLVLGASETTLTVRPADAACVQQWLPASGTTPSALRRGKHYIGGSCNPGGVNPLDSKGKLNNPLMAEVLKLAIIARLNPDFGKTKIRDLDCSFAPIVLQSFRDSDDVNELLRVSNLALGNLVLVPHLKELTQALACLNSKLDICKEPDLVR